MAITAADVAEARVLPQALAGATVLQLVPALRNDAGGRMAIDIAQVLLRSGARAIVAGNPGPLVADLSKFGGEWLPLNISPLHPLRLRRAIAHLAEVIEAERVDIVHARNTPAAWSLTLSGRRRTVRLVADVPGVANTAMPLAGVHLKPLADADRLIAHSRFNAAPLVQRFGVGWDRISVIPRSVDPEVFDPASIVPERIAALRASWGIPFGVRIILVPGRVAPWAGQLRLVDAVRILAGQGLHDVAFVLAGDDRRHPRYSRAVLESARSQRIGALFRRIGHCADMAGAYAASDLVVVPYLQPPVYGRVVAEAQVMARPVIATTVGALTDNLLAPPRIAAELRTGWAVPPGDAAALAQAIGEALTLDTAGYHALTARARQFGMTTFEPRRIALATLEAYRATLAEPT